MFLRILLTTLLIYATVLSSVAQYVLRSTIASGTPTFNSHPVKQSIGQQSVIGTFNTDMLTVRQGFIQSSATTTPNTNTTKKLSLSIYPNPVGSELTIAFDQQTQGSFSLKLINVLGRQVYEKKYAHSEKLIRLPAGHLTTGAYILIFTSDQVMQTYRLLKH